MSVDYRPELGALKSLRPFVFWAQTTLPTVFDDSLSYYEVLTKLTKMVNTLLENTDTTEANVEALATAYDELQAYVNDYFENLDVTTEIDNKLEEWRDAGIIDNMVDSYVAPIIHDYLYGPDDEGGVQKTLEDMLADATESLNNALSTFSTDSRQALNDFERDSRDALNDFEDATEDALDAISTTVDAWLDQNFTNPSSPPLDETLSLENAAAQSKATGERCDQLEDLVLSNNDWVNSVSEVVSNQYVLVNNDGTNPRIGLDASSDPLRPMSVANITGGKSYLISCVGNTVGPNTFSPAYAICNLSYDLQDEPVYTILDFYPRAWDPQIKTYEIIRSRSVYIPETIGLQTVNCLILMGNTDITVTPKCGVLSVRTDNTLTDPMLPANSKAVGDALANKLPWPITEGQKDLGTNGKALLSNGDGTTRWGDAGGDYDADIASLRENKVPWPITEGQKDVGTNGYSLISNGDGTTSWAPSDGNYDQEIAELQNDVSDLKSSINDLTEENYINVPLTWETGQIKSDGTIGTSSSYKHTQAIPVTPDNLVEWQVNGGTSLMVALYETEDGNASITYSMTGIEALCKGVTRIPNGISFVRLSSIATDINNAYLIKCAATTTELEKSADFLTGSGVRTGYIWKYGYIKSDATIVTNGGYRYTLPIPVSAGEKYTVITQASSATLAIALYDSNGIDVSKSTLGNGNLTTYNFIIPEGIVELAVTCTKTQLSNVEILKKGTTLQDLEGSGEQIDSADVNLLIKKSSTIANAEHRCAVINFQFDDGDVKDSNIVNIFNGKNAVCGFSLISSIGTGRVLEYLGYQKDGFEILSHSTDSDGMSDSSVDPSVIEGKLKNSKKVLTGYGFNVRGFVTPRSLMAADFVHLTKKYYDFAYTNYFGEYTGSGTPYFLKTAEMNKLSRVSIQLTTLANMKAAVDAAIANNGFLTFYGHAANLDTSDYETTENLEALLDYINDKQSDLQCVILTPSDAVDFYFHVRHEDYLELLNS